MRLRMVVLLFLLLKYLTYAYAISTLQEAKENERQDTLNPLLLSLKNYHIFEPQHFEDFSYQRKRKGVKTELNDVPGKHLKDVYFSFDFEGKQYQLDLSINKNLMPRAFSTSMYSESGNVKVHEPMFQERNHCYYQGHVKGVKDSQVVMSTCNGLKGCVILPDDFLIIEPLTSNTGNSIEKAKHIIYRPSDVKQHENLGSCGNNDSHVLHMPPFLNRGTLNATHLRYKRNLGMELKFIELLIVANRDEARRFSNRAELEAHIKEIINYVDGFYHHIDVRVVLSHIEIWNATDRIPSNTNAKRVLDDFLQYIKQQRSSAPYTSPWAFADSYHLIYGGELEGPILGLAVSEAMCGGQSAGINQDTFRSTLFTAATIAHELGHNLGMMHDTRDCDCPAASCVMAASTSATPASGWSSCSRSYLKQNLELGLGSCLGNIPEPDRMHWGPECGNDIIEEGEECDCGHPSDCVSKCCNPNTCQLLPGARCDIGLCCYDCQFVSTKTECRSIKDDICDSAEYCTGDSPYCPTDAFIENGTPCIDQATCYNGLCLTHDLQCRIEWGPGSSVSVDICYTMVNALGNQNGNCGLDENGNYIACTSEHAKCGKLLCQGGSRLPIVGKNRYALTNTIASSAGNYVCKAIASDDFARDVNYAGLVKDGTSCAPRKICMAGKCQGINSSKCSSSCSGHGHCTNLGHCHCDVGWAPPDCSTEGIGSSSECGNHIVEDGEECDCGHARECQSKCCNPATCKFLPGAMCDGGECCVECRYAKPAVECRKSENKFCDVAEFCTGISAECPENLYVANGRSCSAGGICYEKKCVSYHSQCRSIWGTTALSSTDTCYRLVNALGNNNGNCGRDKNREFIKCTQLNAKCGKLNCKGTINNPVMLNIALYVNRNQITVRRTRQKCYTITPVQIDSSTANLGVVQDGSPCANGKFCLNGRCQRFEPVRCPSNCGGHGVCTNKGQCYCDPGWSSSDCSVQAALSQCGNGIVEENEECDCGPRGRCDNECCNPATCKFPSDVQCTSGECCTNCQYSRPGTECRSTNDSMCDVAEYCSGFSAECPEDLHVEDGSLCDQGSNACYKGVCLKRDSQCQEIWGEESKSSPDVCYRNVNILGNTNGNCGHNKRGIYKKCSRISVRCGKLQCYGGNPQPVDRQFLFAFRNRLISQGKIINCWTVTSNDDPDDVVHPGLVKDGSLCGKRRFNPFHYTGHAITTLFSALGRSYIILCSVKIRDLSYQNTYRCTTQVFKKACRNGICKPMARSACLNKCNGNGVCNNLGNCHCNPGWAPPLCNVAGNGGSVDSGRTSPDESK